MIELIRVFFERMGECPDELVAMLKRTVFDD